MVHMLKRRCPDKDTGNLAKRPGSVFFLTIEQPQQTALDHFTDFEMAEMQQHKQSQMDEVLVLAWPDAEACGGASRRFLHFYPSELVKTT